MSMSNVDLESVRAAKVVDARGMACPGPLLEAKKAMGIVPVGETIEIWSGDPSTKSDLPKWAAKVGHEFVGTVAGEGYDRIFVTRKK
jgi:TusA-related sulfurtransferase